MELPRKSYMKTVKNTGKTEKEAQIKLKLSDPSEFHVANPLQRSKVGNLTGYKIVPSATASLLDLDDPPQHRSAFTNSQVCFHMFLSCKYIRFRIIFHGLLLANYNLKFMTV